MKELWMNLNKSEVGIILAALTRLVDSLEKEADDDPDPSDGEFVNEAVELLARFEEVAEADAMSKLLAEAQ